MKYAGLDKPDEGTVYAPLATAALSNFLVVRARTDPIALAPAVRRVIQELEPAAPFSNVATVEELAAESLQGRHSLSVLVGGFALVALALSVVGVYGVMAFYVQQHLKEIGIRLALGGRSFDVLRLVVGQGMRVVMGGVGAGLVAALVLTRMMASLLFGVGAADPLTFTAAGAILLTVALLACLIPAARAVRVQPVSVLRND